MALILSKEQLQRLLKEDGVLQLYPSFTENGSPRYTHACVGEPFARVHVGSDGKSGDAEYIGHTMREVRIAPYIKKVDAMEPVEFYPSYIYPNLDLMLYGKLDRFYMSLLKAIHRPFVLDTELDGYRQFMHTGDGTDEKVDGHFLQFLQDNDPIIVNTLCSPQGFNTDKLHAYMDAHNLDAGALFERLRAKWL